MKGNEYNVGLVQQNIRRSSAAKIRIETLIVMIYKRILFETIRWRGNTALDVVIFPSQNSTFNNKSKDSCVHANTALSLLKWAAIKWNCMFRWSKQLSTDSPLLV